MEGGATEKKVVSMTDAHSDFVPLLLLHLVL